MTYPSDDESAMELPAWMKLMRGLVIALLCVSILAMASVGYAAFHLVVSAASATSPWPENVEWPADAEPVSFTRLADGRFLMIYHQNQVYYARISGSDGTLMSESSFQ